MEVQYVYTKKRAEFGRHAIFSDRPAELHVDIEPDTDQRKNFISRNPCSIEVQAAPEMSEHYINTEVQETASTGANHLEGGWPRDINPAEMEQVARYRKKVEKDEGYVRVIQELAEICEDVIRQNNAIDIYEEYFDNIHDVDERDAMPRARTINLFRDPNSVKRSAVYSCWHPDGGRRLAVAYSDLRFQSTDPNATFESYIWNVENPNQPELALKPPSMAVCIEYNPKDSHELLSGLQSGQVCIWDTRKGGVPTGFSNPDNSHRDPVHSALWISSKTGKDFFSGSTDGIVKWWDTRKLSEPIEELILDITKKEDRNIALGCVSLEYEHTMPTKFMVGTELGRIISCNRKAKTAPEKMASIFSGHLGPVYSIARNPAFPKIFLTNGDWSVKIFSEDIRDAPIISSPQQMSHLTSSAWSPTRPGVFFTNDMDGHFDVWDLMTRHSSPSLRVKVSDHPLRSMAVQSRGELIACGAANGETTLLRLSESLVEVQKNEKHRCGALFERETHREKILDARQREMKLKERQRSGKGVREDDETKKPKKLRVEPSAYGGDSEDDDEVDLNALVQEDFERQLSQDKSKLIELAPSLLPTETENTSENPSSDNAEDAPAEEAS